MNAAVPPALAGLYVWAETLEYSALGTAIAESRYAFGLIECAHLLGLAVALGLLLVIDMRLLGWTLRTMPVARLMAQLRPWMLGAFGVVFASGVLLFWSAAARMVASPAFAIKLVLLVLAGINALYFELSVGRRLDTVKPEAAAPARARMAAAASISLWTLTIVFGRLIPYLPSWTPGVLP